MSLGAMQFRSFSSSNGVWLGLNNRKYGWKHQAGAYLGLFPYLRYDALPNSVGGDGV